MLNEGKARVSATVGDNSKAARQSEGGEAPDTSGGTQNKETEAALNSARALWQKYFALTKELFKFSDRTDSDLFTDLVDQRERLIEKIKALPKNNYRESEECKAMIAQMIPMDKQIIYKARAWLNKSRRQNSTVRSYDVVGAAELRGMVFNKKY